MPLTFVLDEILSQPEEGVEWKKCSKGGERMCHGVCVCEVVMGGRLES